MSRLLGLAGLRSLEPFRTSSASKAKANASLNANSSSSSVYSDSVSSGSFVNLKLTAEKLVKEQASVKTDLELANSKLKISTEKIQVLEEKLQNAVNENARLRTMQKEDEKLWTGLESKFTSTKALCDQLNETLQQLHAQVQLAEKDKAFFEDKLSATTVALDKFDRDMKAMSSKLMSADEAVKSRENELRALEFEKAKLETSFRDEQNRAEGLIEEKGEVIKKLEEDVADSRKHVQGLTSEIENLSLEIRAKENDLLESRVCKDKMERDNKDLFLSNQDLTAKLGKALAEIKNLEASVNMLVAKFTEIDKQSQIYAEKLAQYNAMFESCLMLAKQEKDLAAECARRKFDQMHEKCLIVISEKNTLQLDNQELSKKVLELQKEQEFTMVQHAEECRLAEERIRKLESEVEIYISKQNEMITTIAKLEGDVKISSADSLSSGQKVQDLLLKLSEVENESKGLQGGLNAEIIKKQGEIDLLQKKVDMCDENAESFEKRISELVRALEDKDQLVLELKNKEKLLEDQKTGIMASLMDAESKLDEAKKNYDHMLESKQFELSKHLKEISQRNDQAINDIRRKYEMEKQESVSVEKEKASKELQDMEQRYEQKIAECKEESQKHLLELQEEHAAMIRQLQQEHLNKESNLISKNSEELRRAQLQAESDLREKTKLLRSEHEAQLRALKCEHEDECRRLQEELDVQKAKEERQRALLQLQWKVMGDNREEDQEVNSKKNYSSSKVRNSDSGKRTHHSIDRTGAEEKDSRYVNEAQTPVSNLLQKVENVNTANPMSLPKHSRKVTRHEYEIETSNGRTITKRRKTKSTVMFEDPRKHRKRDTPKARTPRNITQGIKSGVVTSQHNIGDLFTEGSLNPYTDDPYAFD